MTRFDEFKNKAVVDSDQYRKAMIGNGSFDFNDQVTELMKLESHINIALLKYLFGDEMGSHLADKFLSSDRNLLRFFAGLNSEIRFFMLYELKTNESLFVHTK